MKNNSIFYVASYSNPRLDVTPVNLTYFEPVNLVEREMIESKIEGSYYYLFEEKEVEDYLNSNYFLQDKAYNNIFVIKNQYMAHLLIKGYVDRLKKKIFKGMVICTDFSHPYKVSDFLNEHNPNLNLPYYFALEKDFNDIHTMLLTHGYIYCKVEFDNYETFFPKNYLLYLNYVLLGLIYLIAFFWKFLNFNYEDHINDLHDMFTSLLIFKCFYVIFIISFLNETYHRPKNRDQEIFKVIVTTFYEKVLIEMNCLFRSIFLVLFIIIFDVNINLFYYLGI